MAVQTGIATGITTGIVAVRVAVVGRAMAMTMVADLGRARDRHLAVAADMVGMTALAGVERADPAAVDRVAADGDGLYRAVPQTHRPFRQ